MADSRRTAPTTTGAWSGVDSGTRWVFESVAEHWRLHEQREVAYWRSQPAEARLAQAARYRVRVHGLVAPPARWSWRFVAANE